MKIKDIRNVKINNYVDFNNYDLTLNEVEEYIDNLDLDNIEIGEFNLFHFKKYNLFVDVLFYWNLYNILICKIECIY